MDEAAQARAALRRWVREGWTAAALDPASSRALATTACEQGVAGLLYADLLQHAPSWPAESLALLHDVQLAWLCRGVQQLDCAGRVQSMLEARGFPSLPLKGAAVLERWHGSAAERPMADVDLLVLEGWPGARDALLAAGFVPLARADHAWALREPESGVVVELHRGVTSCPELHPLDAEGLWARKVAGPGQVRWLPAAEDLLVQLALHAAFQHGLVLSLVQYLDFRRLLAGPLDRRLVLEIAGRMQAMPPLRAALAAASFVVGTPEFDGSRLSVPEGPSDALHLLVPSVPRLARVRWQLCRGRRAQLLWHTLRADDGATVTRPARLWRMGHRAVRLGWQGWRGRPRPRGARTPGPVGNAGRGQPAAASAYDQTLAEAALQLCLREFEEVRLQVTGDCMRPALEPGRTVILAAAARRAPRWGDVVLVRQPEGLRLHRLVLRPPLARFSRGWRSKADRAAAWDRPVGRAAVLATVVAVEGPASRPPRARMKAASSLLRALWTSLLARAAVGAAQ